MNLTHGTEEEHIATLKRAHAAKLSSIWSGDLRNRYLSENLDYAVEKGIIELEPYDSPSAQESGYTITWLRAP